MNKQRDKELNRLQEDVRIMKQTAARLLEGATRIEKSLERLHAPATPSGSTLTALDMDRLRTKLRKKSIK